MKKFFYIFVISALVFLSISAFYQNIEIDYNSDNSTSDSSVNSIITFPDLSYTPPEITVDFDEIQKSVPFDYSLPESKSESSMPEEPQQTEIVVYITDTGEKYHRASCSYLWNSCYSVTLSEARWRGYSPCARCNPPILDIN